MGITVDPVKMNAMVIQVIFAACFALALGAIPPVRQTCTWGGHTFQPGETYSPDPCTNCTCEGHGRPMCAMMACMMPACVDAVHDPTMCCPVCPNGENCRGPNGEVIPAGKDVNVGHGVTCRCADSNHGFMASGSDAMCTLPGPVPGRK